MNRTPITKEDIEERDNACVPESRIDLRRGSKDITYFSMQLLGIRPQTFQHLIYKRVLSGHRRIAVCSSRQIGKEQPYSAKVLTPRGFVNMGDLSVGDEVFSQRGIPTKILRIFEQGEKDVYKLTFDDGSTAECGWEHLWKYHAPHKRNAGDCNWNVGSLKEIVARGGFNPISDKRVSVPITEPVQFSEKKHLISPYVLGAIIGDGGLTTDSITFTSWDDSVIGRVASELPPDFVILEKKSRKHHFLIRRTDTKRNDLKKELSRLSMFGKYSYEKEIPDEYLYDSVRNRVDLLRGLMDTDGSAYGKGVVEFGTSSPRLAENVVWLVRSLGGKAELSIKKTSKKDCHRVFVRMHKINPFWIERKAKRWYSTKYTDEHILWKIKRVRTERSRCIFVEDESHTYLTDDFIVTHNTTALAILAIHSVYYGSFRSGRGELDTNTKVVIISKDDEASKRLMSEIRSMLIAGDAHMKEVTGGRVRDWFTRYVSQERKDPDNKRQLTFVPRKGSTRGDYIHCFPPTDAVTGNPVDLLILDEARFVEDEIYNVSIKPTVSTTGGVIVLSSTPGGQKGFYFDIFDPFDRQEVHEYARLWFPWTVCELEGQRDRVQLEKENAEKMGNIKVFQQEYCYREDTEFLTECGWKKYDDIFGGESLACYNSKTERLEYHLPLSKIKKKSGELVNFSQNGKLVFSVSPEHRVYHKTKTAGFHFSEAKDCPNIICVTDRCGVDGLNIDTISIPNKVNKCQRCGHTWQHRESDNIGRVCTSCWLNDKTKSKKFKIESLIVDRFFDTIDFIKFLGYFISEGNISKNKKNEVHKKIVITQKINEKGKRMSGDLEFLFGRPKTIKKGNLDMYSWTLFDRDLIAWVKERVGNGSYVKHIPRQFLGLSTELSRILLDSLVLGDGWKDKRGNRWNYGTMSKKLSDDVQELALRCGYSTNLHKRTDGMYWVSWFNYHSKYRWLRKSIVPYGGTVVCFTVPTGLLITRLNGRVSIQGNCADFTIDETAFFESKKVDEAIDSSLSEVYEWRESPSCLAIDYGMTSCHTVVTISTRLENGSIRLLYQKEFELGFDDNLLMDESVEDSIPNLLKRFSVAWIVPDSCAQGFRTNKEMVAKGYPVVSNSGSIGDDTGWNFRSDQADRNRGYVSFRSKLHQGLIKMPKIGDLIVQMKALQSVDNKIYTSIRKPQGGKDDRIDSFMMSCIPWTILDDEGNFESDLVVPDKSVLEIRDRWVDKDEFMPQNDAEREEWKLWQGRAEFS